MSGSNETGPTLVGAIGLLVTVSAFAVVAGAEAAFVATTLVVVWLLLPSVYVVAAGHVLIAAYVPDSTVIEFLVVEVGLLILLFEGIRTLPRPGALLSRSVFAAGGLSAVIAVVISLDGRLWVAVVGLLAALALTAYGIHRYELVRLGLVSDA